MNKNNARKIAETITNEQLANMFTEAKVNITDWTKSSTVNKGITKGLAWNILTKNFNITTKYPILVKVKMIREFGEFLPDELKPKKGNNGNFKCPTHQDPIF